MHQLRQLVGHSRIAAQQLARSAGVSENTIRAMARDDAPFPQQSTLEAVVKACGEDPKPWVDAWHRASDARPRPERNGGSKAAQLQIDELTKVVGQLVEQVALLTAKQDAEDDEVQNQQARSERAYHRLLVDLPEARFTATTWVLREPKSATAPYAYWVPEQPAYESSSVDALRQVVGVLAAKQKSLPRLRIYLSSPPKLDAVEERELGVDDDPSDDPAVPRTEVDRYLTEMSECLRSYFAELAESPSHEAP
ncbi:helix-turn-helix domain-containing protein [Streptomyces sp. NPDC056713]|uniref:helix-turn-helix domain-containing protein n=1 Tax=unclassified Streptomyces TaxID=2593676 RepID=UPI0036B3BB47